MFLKMNRRHQAHKPVKKCNYWGPIFEMEWSGVSTCVSVPNFEAIAPTVAEIWRHFDFGRWRPPPSWIFKFLMVGWLKRPNCVAVPNLVKISQTAAEIWRFFKMVAVRNLGFVMCVFRPHTKGIWWSLSLCKMWLESMQ